MVFLLCFLVFYHLFNNFEDEVNHVFTDEIVLVLGFQYVMVVDIVTRLQFVRETLFLWNN